MRFAPMHPVLRYRGTSARTGWEAARQGAGESGKRQARETKRQHTRPGSVMSWIRLAAGNASLRSHSLDSGCTSAIARGHSGGCGRARRCRRGLRQYWGTVSAVSL